MSDFISPRYDDSFIVAPKNAEKTNNTLPPKDMYDAKLSIITNCHTGFQKELIEKAYYFAKDKHRFQKRHSGELYISHPLAVARILSDMKADYETICAALLHDVMEDCNVSKDTIADEFGPVIAELVDGVTKVSDIKEDDKEKKNAMTINKLSISFHDDVRVAFIKLADRIHNMRTIDAHASYEKKARIARQTLDIYAPLAALFGLYPWKEELEDICFRVLKDNEYKQIYELRKNFFSSNPNLSHALFSLQYPNPNNQNSFYRLFQQYDEKSNEYIDLIPLQDVKKIEKSVYGIYKKLSQGTYSDISQIKDLVTFNIVIKEENPSLLFVAMYKVNDKYKVIPVDPLIDYVTHPKNDLYRCLITSNTFKTENDEKMRIRVRYQTPSMYFKSVNGLAGYWNYDDMSKVKEMQHALEQMPIYNMLSEIINEYESGDYTYDEFFKKLNQLISPNRIYVTLNEYDFVQTLEGVTLDEFIMSQNDGLIDLNKDYYVNGNLVNITGDSKKGFRRKNQAYVLHNNDSIRVMQKGEQVEKNIFGGIVRKRK